MQSDEEGSPPAPSSSPPSRKPRSSQKKKRGSTSFTSTEARLRNGLVALNIGGILYQTTRHTLCPPDSPPNYFSSLLDGFYPLTYDHDGRIFIDRPGEYFRPVLEYLQTGDVTVPPGMNLKALVREAAFYCIDFPLGETHESLSFVTDEWLSDRLEDTAYHQISSVADPVLRLVLKQFKARADKGLKIESDPFLVEDQQVINEWLDNSEHGGDYSRFDFIDRQKKLYSEPCIVNDEYFWLLSDPLHKKTIIAYCKKNKLSVEVLPVMIHEPGLVGRHYITVGYKFVHLTNDPNFKYNTPPASLAPPPLKPNSKRRSTGMS